MASRTPETPKMEVSATTVDGFQQTIDTKNPNQNHTTEKLVENMLVMFLSLKHLSFVMFLD